MKIGKRTKLEIVAAILEELSKHAISKTRLVSYIRAGSNYINPLLEDLEALGMVRSEGKGKRIVWCATVKGIDLLRQIEELYKELEW